MMKITNKIIQKQMKRQKGSQSNTKAATNINYNLPQIDPNTFNQTIIINNPNFNINYIQSSGQQNPLNGLKQESARKTQNDNWNLNYNLKQFSETRQVGFFNNKQKRNASNSPYLIPKNKTQDIKPISKIRPSQTIAYGAPYKSNLNPPRSNRSIPIITRQQSPQHLNAGQLSSHITLNRQPLQQGTLSNFRSKKYQYTQKTPRQLIAHRTIGQRIQLSNLQDNKIQIGKDVRDALTDRLKNGAIHSGMNNNYNKIKHNIRRNRFSSVQEDDCSRQNTNKTVLQQEKQQNQSEQEIESPTHSIKKQQSKPNHSKFHSKYSNKSYSQYSKSIQMIHQSLLSNMNVYMEGERDVKQDIPASKIQLYISTMREPQPIQHTHSRNNPQYRSTPLDLWQQYDFKFDQEKVKKRPKTPKRKKLYQ